MATIPTANWASIGGSGTWGMRFPEDFEQHGIEGVDLVEVFADGFETPYGQSAAFKLVEIEGEPVLRVAMHGWKTEGSKRIPTWEAAKQVAYVLYKAGVEYLIVDASVGGICNPAQRQEPLPPSSVVITKDFMMLWRPPESHPFAEGIPGFRRMNNPMCSCLRAHLYEAAKNDSWFAQVHDHGVYVSTSLGRFETAAEIQAFQMLGADIVGMTLGHEAPLWRQLGIHFASLNIVSNFAEGTEGGTWIEGGREAMQQFYYTCAPHVAAATVSALRAAIREGVQGCQCQEYAVEGLTNFPVEGA